VGDVGADGHNGVLLRSSHTRWQLHTRGIRTIHIYTYVYIYIHIHIYAVRCEVTAWATLGPMGITASCRGAVTRGGSYIHVAYALHTHTHIYTYTYIYIYMRCGAR